MLVVRGCTPSSDELDDKHAETIIYPEDGRASGICIPITEHAWCDGVHPTPHPHVDFPWLYKLESNQGSIRLEVRGIGQLPEVVERLTCAGSRSQQLALLDYLCPLYHHAGIGHCGFAQQIHLYESAIEDDGVHALYLIFGIGGNSVDGFIVSRHGSCERFSSFCIGNQESSNMVHQFKICIVRHHHDGCLA